MKLRRLDLIRMPGFPRGGPQLAELGEGLNLVLGRNGSGKTTICRAIRGLLSPLTLANVAPVEIDSRWTEDTQDFTQGFADETIKADPPDNPLARLALPPHLAHCTTITLEDLQPNLQAHEALTDEIARQMSGGFDLEDVKNLFRLNRNHGQPEQKKLRAAQQKVKDLQQTQADLARDEAQLPALEEKKRHADEAKREIGRLRAALDLQDELRDLTAAETALAEYPAAMAKIAGNEADRLRQIRADLQAAVESRQAARDELEAASHDLAAAALAVPPSGELLEANRLRLEEIRKLEGILAEQSAHLAGLQEKVTASLQDLNALGGPGDPGRVDLQHLDRLAELIYEADALRIRIETIDAKMPLLAVQAPVYPLDDLEKGLAALRRWLQIPDSGAWPGLLPRWTLWLGLALASAGIGFFTWWTSPWILLLLAPFPFFFLGIWRKKHTAESEEKARLVAQYQRLPLPGIDAWERETVTERLAELSDIWPAAARYIREEEQRRELAAQRAQLAETQQGIALALHDAAQGAGLETPRDGFTPALLLERLKVYRRACDEQCSLEGNIQEREKQHRDLFAQLAAFLADYTKQNLSSTEAAAAAFADLEKRIDLARRADRAIQAAEKAGRHCEERLRQLREREVKLFADLDLVADQEQELHRRLRMLEAYRRAATAVNDLRVRRDKSRAQLDDRPDLRRQGRPALETALAAATAAAAQYDHYFAQIQSIKNRIAEAGRQQEIENALDDLSQAEEAFAARRTEAHRAAAGSFLMEEIEKQYEKTARPPVVREADRLFNTFTLGKYALKADRVGDTSDHGRALAAIDAESGKHVSFEALSHGAQMQLLLAVRLAFATIQHEGRSLPLLMDEALNSADPERFAAIARCLLHLVREEGRQVFYFTCQPGDVEAWKAVAASTTYDGARLIDLDALAADLKAKTVPLPAATPAPPPIPEPGGMTLDEYAGLLRAPGFDPAAPPGEIHLAHLADDPRDLYRWLSLGIRSGGRLLALAENDENHVYLSALQQARLAAKMNFFRTLADAWRVGRGRPVDRAVLREAGITDTYLDAVAALAENLHGEAQALIDALNNKEVKGFRQQQITKITDQFREQGYCDPRPKLTREEIRTLVLAGAGTDIRMGTIQESEVIVWLYRYCPD